DDPAFGRIRPFGPAWRLSDGPRGIQRPAPRLGEHNEYVLGELVGLPAAELRRLQGEGVVF
ncbi:MAG: CoA transferase, partial [Chloroflexi bacterium]|nr:CoA transferase [Chloroflexota bacterium]